MRRFKGEQHHSSQHPGGEAYAGKQCVVIGSNNSAHDICADLWEHGADVTMVQRSSTHVVALRHADGARRSAPSIRRRRWPAGITTEKADLIFASLPYRILHDVPDPGLRGDRASATPSSTSGSAKAGFMLDFGEDESGLFMKYLRRGSGYYIDVGASELVADGTIKLKSGVDGRARSRETRSCSTDGTELPADLIVYATGYGSMNGWAADADLAGGRRQGRQVLGPRLRHGQGPRPVGGRAAQHVEADAAGGAVVPRRQPAPVAPLLAVSWRCS